MTSMKTTLDKANKQYHFELFNNIVNEWSGKEFTTDDLMNELKSVGFTSISAVKSKEAYQLWCLAYKKLFKTQIDLNKEILLHFDKNINVS